ncbi:hypothetical protein CC86DRAFT_292726 [Ophiobolus disseminans]|uniref:Uncharacterized protein n=1 Tax=Ophiobolus disseminans TaxID=1469910 RepID=A0A6A7A074_9PLEO|nr:hypothetical protein CC86DRAFT_292726 [Ophiobolus disseminans]
MQKEKPQFSTLLRPLPDLQDLSNLLYTRSHLQEMGCTFTIRGEMVAYGNPETNQDFDQLLRLGPVYDKQWSLFFIDLQATPFDDNFGMWPELRTLNRMLKNEGIEFGYAHGRLTHGDASPRIIRLCTAYDDLLKLWPATVTARTPTRALTSVAPSINQQEDADNTFNGSSYTVTDDERSSASSGHAERPWALRRESGIARNIGWRFSDEIDDAAVAGYCDSMSDGLIEELENDLEITVRLPLPVMGDDLTQPSPPIHTPQATPNSSIQIADHGRLRHESSPLQVGNYRLSASQSVTLTAMQQATAPNLMIRDGLMANARGNYLHSLVLDAGFMAMMVSGSTGVASKAKSAKKKGFRAWCRGVFNRK